TLKPTSASSSVPCGRPRSASTLAKPKPWISPKQNATIQRRPWNTVKTLFSAASTTDSAIADSTQRDGSDSTPSVASDSVIECATVNDVTMRTTSQNASRQLSAALQRPSRHTSTAG